MASKDTQKYLTLDALLSKSDLRQEDKYIPRLGAYVRMRELSAAEVFHIRQQSTVTKDGKSEVDSMKNASLSLSTAMLEPKMTPAQVEALFEKSSQATDELVRALQEMNAVTEAGKKEAENSFRGRPGEEVPVPAGGEAGDDGSTT